MTVSLSLVCALIAAISYGTGSVLQAVAARRAEMRPNLDPMLLVRLAGDWSYVGGIALDLLGFVAAVAALRTLPLFLVQAAVAGSVGVTAIVSAVVFRVPLRRSERFALVGLLVGFALLAVSAQPDHATSFGNTGRVILIAGVALVLLIGAKSARLDDRRAGFGLAIAAGLSWTGTGVAARDFHVPPVAWHLVFDPVALALVVYAVLGALFFAAALQRSSATSASALVFLVETVVPSAIGIVFLGDGARPHWAPVAALGFFSVVCASIALARQSVPLREVGPDAS